MIIFKEKQTSFLILNLDLELKSSLTNLGLENSMDPSNADFSGIDGRRNLYLTSVFQTNRMSFGGIGLGTRKNPLPSLSFNWRKQFSEARRDVNKIDDVIFDRPFFYLLREKSTGLILFIGRFSKPDLMSNKF